ncbi:MAG TPA: AI-2E family transporter [Ilumatobacteraceae bacterium]|nr:AI-2E family transporter [Ilumatobacteraceae bacterium]
MHPVVDRLGAYSWRLIGIGVVALAALWLLSRMRAVAIPIIVAVFLSRILAPISEWLRRHRWPASVAAAASLLAFFVVLAGAIAAIAPSVADETESLGTTLTEAIDDVEDWVVEDGPFNVSRETVDRLRERTGERFDGLLRESDGAVLEGATLVAEVIAGLILALLLTFFMLRDGARFTSWVISHARPERQLQLRRAAEGGWSALGGYLRGAALLGLVESVIIGITLFAVGAGLVVPVMLLTFAAAFIPIIGAIAAGVVAILVALVTGGTVAALIVAVVALVVQQLDNDVLAPIIYGRSLSLHPVTVLLSVVAGGALFGIAGTVLAVPLVAVTVNVTKEIRVGDTPGDVTAQGV